VALIDLIQPLIDKALAKIKAALGPFGKLFDLLGKFWDHLTNLRSNVANLYQLILSEIQAWRTFKENLAFRTKVINVKAAVDHIQDFIDELKKAWDAVKELAAELKGKFQAGGNPIEEAEEASKDIESSGLKTLLEKFPRLAKGLEKVLGFLAILIDAMESILTAVDDLTTIVNTLKDIRELIESGGPLFLQQGNTRRTVTLDDGTKMRIRVGSLHDT
jgi:septation ring formation regulator EzrA